MLSDKAYKKISVEFIGDEEDSLFNYKSGNHLVEFFNSYFNTNHTYGSGFPSRWHYVSENLKKLDEASRLSEFFAIILSKRYILEFEERLNENVEEEIEFKRRRLNRLLTPYSIDIKIHNDKVFLINPDIDLELIDSGGFANVYRIMGLNKAKKILKYSEKVEQSSRSRFKREFDITKSLSDLDHVIKVNNYNPSECSYEMELAESNLHNYINENEISDKTKLWIIRHVVETMSQVHERNIIHRDLSPSNILVANQVIKVCDFGIGKELNQSYSHNTLMTKNIGQLHYSAPEQLASLKNASKESDVYSLGKLLNFIFTKDPMNSNHELKSICIRATANTPLNRHSDAGQLLNAIEQFYEIQNNSNRKEKIKMKMNKSNVDKEVFEYIASLTQAELDDFMDETVHSSKIIIKIIEMESSLIEDIVNKLHNIVYRNFDLPYSTYDRYAAVAQYVLANNDYEIGYDEQVLAAEIINFVAKDVNRFSVQDQVEQLLGMAQIDDSIKVILGRN